MAAVDSSQAEKAAKSQKFMEESFDFVNRQRFGLFSQPGGLCIGENNYDKIKVPKKDTDGRVLTQPPNFLTTKVKTGHTDQILFSAPSYVSQGDPYNDNKLKMREGKKDGYKAVSDLQFKPAKTIQRAVKHDFEWMPEENAKKKNYKDADGNVIVGPRNFVTTGPKKGHPGTTPGTLFEKEFYPHMKDEYDMKRDLARKEHIESQKKMQEKPFSQRIKGVDTFGTVQEVFGEEGCTFKPKKPPAKTKPQVEHDKPFKPSNPPKRGIVDKTIAKFPDYIEEKPEPKKRKAPKEDERMAWKPNTFKKVIINSLKFQIIDST